MFRGFKYISDIEEPKKVKKPNTPYFGPIMVLDVSTKVGQ